MFEEDDYRKDVTARVKVSLNSECLPRRDGYLSLGGR